MSLSPFSQYLRVLSKLGTKRLFWPTVFLFFSLYAFLPLFNESNSIGEARSSPGLAAAMESLRNKMKELGPPNREERYYLHNLTPFAQVSIPYQAYWDTDSATPSLKTEFGRSNLGLRFDQIALAAAAIVMLALTATTLYSTESTTTGSTPAAPAMPPPLAQPSTASQSTSARQVFEKEVQLAAHRADTLFTRSTYLLTGGVMMAFVGVAVFYATLPEPGRDETQTTYWIRAVRSAGMLIFLEAIAWFLLRQYRSLIEDFKSFHRIYMKRANYLATITLLEKEQVRPEDLLIASALLGEDLTGRLSTGETTESIENLKNEGTNPIFNLVHEALGKAFSRNSQDKPAQPPSQG